MLSKPFSQACENNKAPILSVLERVFSGAKHVLEIGSGTGQHAVHFAEHLSHLRWQCSDRAPYIPGIEAWLAEFPRDNLPPCLTLDAIDEKWPSGDFDAAFSANTAHIMSWDMVVRTFEKVGACLQTYGTYALYGPFNYGGLFTSESNFHFDAMLRGKDPQQGIRDFEKVNALAQKAGLKLLEDNTMPANNRLLVWEKTSQEDME